MTPQNLRLYLDQLITNRLYLSTMIWGPPGIGKSSIVAQIADANRIALIDVRLSQLAPTDLRGLPVAVDGRSRWYPPEFLPTEESDTTQYGEYRRLPEEFTVQSQSRDIKGILFLDELNMAPPVMQGIAQQLILDRKVGSYTVPAGWFIWAAGNRKEDKASVFEMPAPLANRFLHLSVEPDFDSFKAYALSANFHEQIIAFLSFRPSLLHKPDGQNPAWPSPRSWEMANQLHRANLDVAPVIGEGTATEFTAYLNTYRALPDLEAIVNGNGNQIAFPEEASVRYATTIGLTVRSDTPERALHGFRWLTEKATAEWTRLFIADLFRLMRTRGQMHVLTRMMALDPQMQKFLQEHSELLRQ